MSRWLLGGFLFLLCTSLVVAEQMDVYVGQSSTIITACLRNSQLRSTATATIIIYNENGTVLVPQTNMTAIGDGTFAYAYVFNDLGAYSTKETCDFSGLLADGSTAINVIKPNFGSMQVIAQGTAQVDMNRPVVSEWLILLPNSTNNSVSSIRVTGGACSAVDLNGSVLNVSVSAATTDDKLTATFSTDPVNFNEGTNYQVLCNITLTNGMYVNGVKNYVYINSQTSFLQYILELLGFAQRQEATANQTLSITNQTLQIVSGLNMTGSGNNTMIYEYIPQVLTAEVNTWESIPVQIRSRVTVGSQIVNDANCSLVIMNQQTSEKVVDGVFLNDADGYVYNWTNPTALGTYSVVQNCTGGTVLNTRVVYGISSATVSSGVVMMSIS